MVKSFFRRLYDLLGWKTQRKIIVFESDDWGSERIPSKEAFWYLKKNQFNVEDDPYCNYDTFASYEDLTLLFETLKKFKDKNSKHPVITANTIMANPDFKKIKESNFEHYFYKPAKFASKFFEGIDNHFLKPQYHGREHLNVNQWMNALRRGDNQALDAFQVGVYGFPSRNRILNRRNDYMAAYDLAFSDEYEFIENSIEEGLDLFKEMFHFTSKSTIAPSYTWNNKIEKVFSQKGVMLLQGNRTQKIPVPEKLKYKLKRHYLGQRNNTGQIYLVRNCAFEVALDNNDNIVEKCIKRMEYLFSINKPVIISMHRLNFIGSLDKENRDKTLDLLNKLLSLVLARWPDVEFMSSDELGSIILNKLNNNQPIN